MKRQVVLLILLFVVACSQTPATTDSILDISSCDLPCWNNITPGYTTGQDAVDILSGLSVIDRSSILVRDVPWNGFDSRIFYEINRPYRSWGKDSHSEILILNDLVVMMDLCGDLHITIDEIIEKTGNPKHVITLGIIHGSTIVMLVNPKIGISYWYDMKDVSEEIRSQISPESEISCISLFDPKLYEMMLDASLFSMGHLDANETLKVAYPWDGYGDVLEKYPLRRP